MGQWFRDRVVEYLYLVLPAVFLLGLALAVSPLLVSDPSLDPGLPMRSVIIGSGIALLWCVVWTFRRAPQVLTRRKVIRMAFVLVTVSGIEMSLGWTPNMVWLGPALGWPWAAFIIIREFKFTKRESSDQAAKT
ncbi:MAG TPA: hypothetical protein VMJ72_00410 [Candidatus Paceibacterota bacterium]|nr:hypothetical protein [Candidatus Paceibacterota bacterium]